jgi:hypothetical protein
LRLSTQIWHMVTTWSRQDRIGVRTRRPSRSYQQSTSLVLITGSCESFLPAIRKRPPVAPRSSLSNTSRSPRRSCYNKRPCNGRAVTWLPDHVLSSRTHHSMDLRRGAPMGPGTRCRARSGLGSTAACG